VLTPTVSERLFWQRRSRAQKRLAVKVTAKRQERTLMPMARTQTSTASIEALKPNRNTFANKDDLMVIDANSDFLRFLKDPEGAN